MRLLRGEVRVQLVLPLIETNLRLQNSLKCHSLEAHRLTSSVGLSAPGFAHELLQP